MLSLAILAVGAMRQRGATAALRRGSFEELTSGLVFWLTGAAAALSIAAIVLVTIAL